MLVTDGGIVTLVSRAFRTLYLPHESSSTVTLPAGILKCFLGICNELHPQKAVLPMLVTDDGIARLANELHLWKAPSPMLVTDDGIARRANERHPEKAKPPMLVTDDGISRLANELQFLKAWSPRLVTDDGTVTCVTFALSTPHSFHESTPSP